MFCSESVGFTFQYSWIKMMHVADEVFTLWLASSCIDAWLHLLLLKCSITLHKVRQPSAAPAASWTRQGEEEETMKAMKVFLLISALGESLSGVWKSLLRLGGTCFTLVVPGGEGGEAEKWQVPLLLWCDSKLHCRVKNQRKISDTTQINLKFMENKKGNWEQLVFLTEKR